MASSTIRQRKLALVIGINNYPHPHELNYCINDARDIKVKLESIRFRVTLGIDCDKDKFMRLINDFTKNFTAGDLILFYFAGHGNQFEEKNYLLPAGYSYDHSTNERKFIEENSINAQYILHKIEAQGARVTICILDCCRIYVKNRSINSQPGLATIKGPPESLIAFSCGFNQGGIDETQNNRNGIFTEHLLKYIATSDQDIETILQMVARDIKKAGFPLPWRASCLTEKIYLVTENSAGTQTWPFDSDDRPNFDEMMYAVTNWYHQTIKYPFGRVVARNLLLMGKIGVGKTTVDEVLQDPCYIPPRAKLRLDTHEITFHSIVATMINDSPTCCLNIIKTSGIFDGVKTQNKQIINQRIKSAFDKCIKLEITRIHLFAFVIDLQGVSEEDIDSMVFVKDNYPMLHPHICLLVTHCEETSSKQRKRQIDEFFRSYEIFKHNLKDFFGGGVFFMGSLRPELRIDPDVLTCREQITNVLQMRDIILQYITSLEANHSFNIYDLDTVKSCTLF